MNHRCQLAAELGRDPREPGTDRLMAALDEPIDLDKLMQSVPEGIRKLIGAILAAYVRDDRQMYSATVRLANLYLFGVLDGKRRAIDTAEMSRLPDVSDDGERDQT